MDTNTNKIQSLDKNDQQLITSSRALSEDFSETIKHRDQISDLSSDIAEILKIHPALIVNIIAHASYDHYEKDYLQPYVLLADNLYNTLKIYYADNRNKLASLNLGYTNFSNLLNSNRSSEILREISNIYNGTSQMSLVMAYIPFYVTMIQAICPEQLLRSRTCVYPNINNEETLQTIKDLIAEGQPGKPLTEDQLNTILTCYSPTRAESGGLWFFKQSQTISFMKNDTIVANQVDTNIAEKAQMIEYSKTKDFLLDHLLKLDTDNGDSLRDILERCGVMEETLGEAKQHTANLVNELRNRLQKEDLNDLKPKIKSLLESIQSNSKYASEGKKLLTTALEGRHEAHLMLQNIENTITTQPEKIKRLRVSGMFDENTPPNTNKQPLQGIAYDGSH
jgi:hypothetical protein